MLWGGLPRFWRCSPDPRSPEPVGDTFPSRSADGAVTAETGAVVGALVARTRWGCWLSAAMEATESPPCVFVPLARFPPTSAEEPGGAVSDTNVPGSAARVECGFGVPEAASRADGVCGAGATAGRDAAVAGGDGAELCRDGAEPCGDGVDPCGDGVESCGEGAAACAAPGATAIEVAGLASACAGAVLSATAEGALRGCPWLSSPRLPVP